MIPARKLTTPPAPASHTRTKAPQRSLEEMRLDARRLLPRVDGEVRTLRALADHRAGMLLDGHAARLDADARALQDEADELRWLASLAR